MTGTSDSPNPLHGLLRGAGGAFLAKSAGAGLLFLFHALVARWFGPAGSGIFGLALTTAMLVGIVARRGLDNALVRFVAAARAAGDWGAVRGLYAAALRWSLVASVVLAAVIWYAADWLAVEVFDDRSLARSLQWMGAGLVPMSLFRLNAEALRGFGWITSSQVLKFVCVPTVAAIALFVMRSERRIHAPAWSYVIGLTAAAGLSTIFWIHATPQLRGARRDGDAAALRRASRPLLWASLLPLAVPAVGLYMLGVREGRRDAGIYQVAVTTAGLTSFILVGFNAILAPRFAALHARGERDALEHTARTSVRLMTGVALVPLLLFVGFPELVLGLFGPRFLDGATALTVLAAAQFLSVAAGPVNNLLMMTGHERLVRDHTFAGLVACIALNAWWTPRYGIDGAASATAAGMIVQNALSLVRVRQRLGIRLWV